jgi:hypothetical protein
VGLTASQAWGHHLCGRWCCGLRNDAGLTTSWACGRHVRGQWHRWLGSGKIAAHMEGLTRVRNDSAKDLGRTR